MPRQPRPRKNKQIIIVGAGPVGLSTALALAKQGVASVVVEAESNISQDGSKAVVIQRRTLEIFEWAAPGTGQAIRQAGITWNIKRTYFRDKLMFSETYADTAEDDWPPFVNLPQTETDRLLLEAAQKLYPKLVTFCFGFRVASLKQQSKGVLLTSTSGETLEGSFVIGCDGAHSTIRKQLGIPLHGKSSANRFLITDIKAKLPFPRERRFFYDPSSNRNRQILIMPQPNDIWRIDWQVGPEVTLEDERNGQLDARIQAIIGPDIPYTIVWSSLYRFHNLVAETFQKQRVFLAGDAAHVMSPFGGRGMNSGVADAEYLAKLLGNVLLDKKPLSHLKTYTEVRRAVALENIAATSRALRTMEPPTTAHLVARNITLCLARFLPRLRRFVDSGPYATHQRIS